MSERLRSEPIELKMEVETHDDTLGFKLFESPDRVSYGQIKIICDEVSIRAEGGRNFEALDFPSILYVTAFFGKNVVLPIAVSLFSSYLYDKLKERKDNKLRINGTQVEINAEKIEQLILIILKQEKEKEEKS
ncbi:MAG: hypothetical protein ABSB89_08535 [Candidatus Bathyarchaeia archaeon]|jgi:hypothetical protein